MIKTTLFQFEFAMSGQLNMAKPISTRSVPYIEDLICAKRKYILNFE